MNEKVATILSLNNRDSKRKDVSYGTDVALLEIILLSDITNREKSELVEQYYTGWSIGYVLKKLGY